MFSNRSFGGIVFWGKAFVPKPEPAAIADALSPCEHTSPTHPITAGIVLGAGEKPHYHDGYPDFEEWPTYSSMMHQQMYVDWLFRAYQYGLRLVVITATNSEVICNAAEHPLPCNDEAVVEDQIKQIQEMADWVANNEFGGDRSRPRPWLEIVKSSSDAKRVVQNNRLAVVIGVEVDNLFDCGPGKWGRECDQAHVDEMLKKYYELGVRQITPIHLAESAFGGNALYDDRFLANSYYLRSSYQVPRRCPEEGVFWRPLGAAGVPLFARVLEYGNGLGWYSPPYEDPAVSPGACNPNGLSELGQHLIRGMMKKGMLVDMEHMSQRSTDDTLSIAAGAHYPVMVSHAWFRDLKLERMSPDYSDPKNPSRHWTDQRSEMHTSRETLEKIRALGGVVGVLTNQGPVEDHEPPGHNPPVENDCDTSSKSFATAYLYALKVMGNMAGVGIGTDVNGLAGQPGPRFGVEACGKARDLPEQKKRVSYDGNTTVDSRPLTRYHLGNRSFDFNEDGLAHYGLLPDMIADLEQVGVPSTAVDTLFNSAAAYITMWKLAESRSGSLQ
jgi:microsomal dipeptidase-like Zn-dependent dipeptidase